MVARRRTRLLRKAQFTGSQRDWDLQKRVERAIKHLVKKKKKVSFAQFTEEVQTMQLSEAHSTINRIVRAEKCYAARYTATGAGLDPNTYTAFFGTQSQPPRPVYFSPIQFAVAPTFLPRIAEYIRHIPRKKAPAPYLMI